MYEIRTGSDAVIGAALMQLGITFHKDVASSTLPRDEVMAKLRVLFKKRIADAEDDAVVIVTDHHGKQFVVKNLREAMHVWGNSRVDHAFTMSREAFERIRGDIVISPVYKK